MSSRDVIAAIERAHPGGGLDQVASAVFHAGHRLRPADQLLDYFVDRAQHAGMPWTEVGAHLGVSRQSAQQRFATRVAERHAATTRR
ncbi:hypothetical protein [Nocardia sp. NPDC047648]|uniref:hypothetical protein n=1 Tax=Nocardia sp. NPDC047648 TaxID=3155625 RepID=UPI0033F95B8C